MEWEKIVADPQLADLPYKIEMNKWGGIVMSPASLKHGVFQIEIAKILDRLLGGLVISECAVETEEKVKVSDVAWLSLKRWEIVKDRAAASIAPEICIEIMSPGNSVEELMEKKRLYLKAGALEFWLCAEDGAIRFFDGNGEETDSSELAPKFPKGVTIPG